METSRGRLIISLKEKNSTWPRLSWPSYEIGNHRWCATIQKIFKFCQQGHGLCRLTREIQCLYIDKARHVSSRRLTFFILLFFSKFQWWPVHCCPTVKIGLLVFFRSILSPTVSTWVCRASNVRESRVVEIYYYLTSFFFLLLFSLLLTIRVFLPLHHLSFLVQRKNVPSRGKLRVVTSAVRHCAFFIFLPLLVPVGQQHFLLVFSCQQLDWENKKARREKRECDEWGRRKKKKITRI